MAITHTQQIGPCIRRENGDSMTRYNPSPSRALSYSTLEADDRARFAHPVSIPKVGREQQVLPANGNLRLIIPDIDSPQVWETLSPTYKVNTSTRTVFNNDRAYELHDGIADKVASPTWKNSAPIREGHASLDTMSATDPRQQHKPMSTSPELGPGCYHTDPSGMQATAISAEDWLAQPSHYMAPLSRDPTRASPAFRSPPRGKTQQDLAADQHNSSVPWYAVGPDYTSWTTGGIDFGKFDRKIEAERWGANLREPRPLPVEATNAAADDLELNKSGVPVTVLRYIQDPASPTYKVAFQSKLPRTLAIPSCSKPDTRVTAKSYEKLSNTPAHLGPGSFKTDVASGPRSWHVAYHGLPSTTYAMAQVQRSASASPTRLLASRGSCFSRGCNTSTPTTPIGKGLISTSLSYGDALHAPVSVAAQGPAGGLEQPPTCLSPSCLLGGGEFCNVLSMPMESVECEDADWEVHQRVIKAKYAANQELRGLAMVIKQSVAKTSLTNSLHMQPSVSSSAQQQLPVCAGNHGIDFSNVATPASGIAALASCFNQFSDHSIPQTPNSTVPSSCNKAGLDTDVSQGTIQLKVSSHMPGDDELVFLRRKVSHKSAICTRVKAQQDLRTARKQVRDLQLPA